MRAVIRGLGAVAVGRTIVADVTDTVGIGIRLIAIRCRRAVVTGIADTVGSDSSSDSARAEQFTGTKGPWARGLW